MNVGAVGSGPAAEAVRAALSDLSVSVSSSDPDAVGALDFAVVTGSAGDERFERANDSALRGGTPWLAVEVGGLGGRALPDVAASVAGFAPETGCHRCLSIRVASNLDGEDGEAAGGEADERGASAADARLAGARAGRAAVSLLSGEADPILGGVTELPHAERRFQPVPGCPVCGGERDRTLERGHAERTLEDALSRAERALDGRVGLVRSVGEAESFPTPYYLATNCDTSGFSDAAAAKRAAGVSVDWNEAFMKALGEALERYSAGVYRASEFTVAPASDLGSAVPPSRFVRPSSSYEEPDPDRPIPWVEGAHIGTGEAVHLPATFVQFPPSGSEFKPSITTGLGLGNSTDGALLSGLYETVERDATMLAWYSTFEPLGLSVADEGFATLARRARSEGLSVSASLVTQDADVPVVAVAVHREDGWPKFAVGSGADLDAEAAARSALGEALQNWMELRGMGPEDAASESGAIGRFADLPDEARELIDVEGGVPAAGVGPSPVPDGAAELDLLVERVRDAGLEPYAARLTPRDVAGLGFEAVRVLVPAAQPLFTGEPYFGERAAAVPRELGFEPRPERTLHPYP